MKQLFTILFLGVVCPICLHAQKLDKVTSLHVDYWRAFHGLITLDARSPSPSGEVSLSLTVVTPDKNDDKIETKKVSTRIIKKEDLDPLLTYFNFGDVRQFFANSEQFLQPDGSALSVTLLQNSFSISFTSQDAFSSKAGKIPARLGYIVADLFKKAGLTVNKDELY